MYVKLLLLVTMTISLYSAEIREVSQLGGRTLESLTLGERTISDRSDRVGKEIRLNLKNKNLTDITGIATLEVQYFGKQYQKFII